MLSCTDDEIESLLDPSEVISAIRAAFARDLSSLHMPNRVHLDIGDGTQLIMPCAIAGERVWGTKIVSVSRESRPEGRVRASYMLFDAASARPIALFEANYLTDVRTAATSAIATDLLARPDASILGVFGTGRQAAAHIAILPRIRNFRQVLICASSFAKSEAFAGQMGERYRLKVAAADAVKCASSSDVICTCTNSCEPLFPGELVRPGTHLNLIGAFQPHAREADSALIQRSRVFVDTYEGCLAEAGDILIPLRAKEIQRNHVCGDLHELLSDLKPGRPSAEDITVFKSVGCALEDLVTAKLVMQALRKRNASA